MLLRSSAVILREFLGFPALACPASSSQGTEAISFIDTVPQGEPEGKGAWTVEGLGRKIVRIGKDDSQFVRESSRNT